MFRERAGPDTPHKRYRPEVYIARVLLATIGMILIGMGMFFNTSSADAEYTDNTSSGNYSKSINWIIWPAAASFSKTEPVPTTTALGNNRFITCTYIYDSGDTVTPYSTLEGASNRKWSAGFNSMYSLESTALGGTGGGNALNAIENTTGAGGSTANFTLNCSAYYQKTASAEKINIPLQGLVFADAESTNWGGSKEPNQFEYISVSPIRGDAQPQWRLLDSVRGASCTTSSVADTVSLAGTSGIRFRSSGEQCADDNGTNGPASTLFMQGSTSANVSVHGGGYTGIVLGVILNTDYGGAPESYGEAGSVFQSKWTGGLLGGSGVNDIQLGSDGVYNLSVAGESGHLAQETQPMPRLRDTGNAESSQRYSADATSDDPLGNDDEDSISATSGISITPEKDGDNYTYTQQVNCTSGYVAGWIDWNQDGSFLNSDGSVQTDEQSSTAQCGPSGTVNLEWTVPIGLETADQIPGTDDPSDTFLRIRGASTPEELQPTGTTPGGSDGEDDLVHLTKLKLSKVVDNSIGGTLQPSDWMLKAADPEYDFSPVKNSDGTYTTQYKLVVPAEYTLSESTSQPDGAGYTNTSLTCGGSAVNASSITVSAGKAISCTFTNTSNPGSVSWQKVDADHASVLLTGSSWTLTGPNVPSGVVVADCTSSPCESGEYADQDPTTGKFQISGLKWGSYTLSETLTPAGYTRNTKTYTFTVSATNLTPTLESDSQPTGNALESSKSSVPDLPLTGGIGSVLFWTLGVLVLVSGAGAGGRWTIRRWRNVHR